MYSLRATTENDEQRLREVHHAAFRDAVTAVWGWDEALQDRFFADALAAAPHEAIVYEGEIVGYLEVHRHPDHIFLANLAIDPAMQGRGVGTAILRDLIAESEVVQLPLRLQVLKSNTRALTLYQRLGFKITGATDTHHQMERESQPQSMAPSAS